MYYPEPISRIRMATLANSSAKGGYFSNNVSALRTAGFIVDASQGYFCATGAGVDAAGDFDPLPTGQDLVDLWKQTLGGAPGRILQALFDHYPDEMTREQIGDATGIEITGGYFSNSLSKVRSNRLLEEPSKGVFRAAAELME